MWLLAWGDSNKLLKAANDVSIYSWYHNSYIHFKHLHTSLQVKHVFSADLIWGAHPPSRDHSIHLPVLTLILWVPRFWPMHQQLFEISSCLWLHRNLYTFYKAVQTYNRSHTFQCHFKYTHLLMIHTNFNKKCSVFSKIHHTNRSAGFFCTTGNQYIARLQARHSPYNCTTL